MRKPKDDAQTTGSSGDAADAAVDSGHHRADHDPQSPHTRPARTLGKSEKPDQLAEKARDSRSREEALLEEGIEESFPASDPVSAHHIT